MARIHIVFEESDVYAASPRIPSKYSLYPQMDDPPCLGCGHSFASRKKLSSHELQCKAYVQVTADVFRSQRRLQKGRKVWRDLVPQVEASGADDPVEMQADDQPTPMEELQVCLLFLTDK